MEQQQKEITFDCWHCAQKQRTQADSEGIVAVTCSKCGLQYRGPAEFFRDHRSDGFALQLPLRAKARQFRIVVVE